MPKDGWYGPAIDNWAPVDGGSHLGPVTIGLLHTTESSRFSPSKDSYFGHSSYPHFTAANDNGTFKCWQHISIRRAARALRNTAGGVQTNREGVIQIEVVGRATQPFTNDSILTNGLRDLMRWIESQTQIPRSSSVVWRRYPDSYGASPVRMSRESWISYAGWLGHQHAPENSHGDPGAININALLAVTPQQEEYMAMTQGDKDEMKAHINQIIAPIHSLLVHFQQELDMMRRDNRDFAVAIGSIQKQLGVPGEPLSPAASHSLDNKIES